MRYAKLINNYPSYAPRKLRVGDTMVYNPLPEQLLADGYLPVRETAPPEVEDGYYAEPHWTEQDGEIIQSWTVEKNPTTDEDALVRYANELTGASDQTLTEAAETMILKITEEE